MLGFGKLSEYRLRGVRFLCPFSRGGGVWVVTGTASTSSKTPNRSRGLPAATSDGGLASGGAVSSERSTMEGTMIWFNPAKHHGFIRTDDGERLRVDETGFEAGHVLGDRCRGTRVTFERSPAELDARAINVTVVPLMAARRARSRGRR
jgi:cold shock CspA family protein